MIRELFRADRSIGRIRILKPVGHALLVFLAGVVGAQEVAVELAPTVSVPLGATTERFSPGFGAQLQGVLPIGESSLSGLGTIDYTRTQLAAGAGTVDLVRMGGGVLYDLIGLGPVTLGAQARAGAYLATLAGSDPLVNPYVGAGLRIAVGLGRSFELSLQPSYDVQLATRDGQLGAFYSGLTTALSFSLAPARLSSGARKPRIEIAPPQFSPVYPVIYKYYDSEPFGTVTLQNGESQLARNIRVEFHVPQYMGAPQLIAEIPELAPRDELEVPITALFSNDILGITEADSLQSQIIVSYDVGGTFLTTQRTSTLRVQDRNAISWDDDRKVAAFITTRDPAILRMSRNTTAGIGEVGVTALNRRFRDAMALFYAMQQAGIRYQIDPDSAYAELSQDSSSLDYVQFPTQTLDYRSGDCDDLTVLYSALLEAVGIQAAFITIPGHLYSAFSLGMSEEEARRTFSSPEELIIIDGEAWIPVETTLLQEDFLEAWRVGAQQWREASARDTAAFFKVSEAQQVFQPTWFESQAPDLRMPDSEQITVAYRRSMDRFVSQELSPLVAEIEARLAERRSPRLLNRLGTIYARFGLLSDAEQAFAEAARENYVPALVNMGNVFYLRNDLPQAAHYFGRAQSLSPDNPDVLVGLARTQYELERYEEARENIDLARVIDPSVAEQFAYIGGGSEETARASNAQKRDFIPWSE